MTSDLKAIYLTARRVWFMLANGQRAKLWLAVGFMATAAWLNSRPPLVLGALLDRMMKEQVMAFSAAGRYLMVIMAAVFAREACTVARRLLVESAATRIEKDTRVQLIDHLLRLPLAFLQQHQSGALNGRVGRCISGLIRLVKLSFLDFLPSVCLAAFALYPVLWKAPVLGMVMGLVLPVGLLIVMAQIHSQRGVRLELLRGKEQIDGTVVELLGNVPPVRAMHAEDAAVVRVDQVAEHLRQRELRHHVAMAAFDAVKAINEGTWYVVVIALAIYLATRKVLSVGDVLSYSVLFISVMNPIREIHRIFDEAHESTLTTGDLLDLLDEPVDASFSVPELAMPAPVTAPALAVDHVSFNYPDLVPAATSGAATHQALDTISFRVDDGQFVGFCGPTGCGKSSILKLLLGLYRPDRGKVFLFGYDIATLTRAQIADLVGYVGQDPFCVSGSIRENITYGLGDVTDEAVVEAARLAQLHDEIALLPDGYQTQLGENGAGFSGGQRQRLALARVFLRSPRILLLDEATSALDNLNERAVQDAIRRAMAGRTVVAVAHRLGTICDADRIFVFNGGRIEESGTYDDLRNGEGLFQELVRAEHDHRAESSAAVGVG